MADAIHALLVLRTRGGCTEGSEEAVELEMTVAAIEAYEATR
jgi:hypothetical protein